MYNAKLSVEIQKVEPYNDNDRGKGIIFLAKLETKDRKFFDDVNLAGKEEGLSRLLSGELPIRGNKVPLSFIKQAVEMEFGGSKHIPVELIDIFTGAIGKDNIITIFLKLDIKKLNEEIAGELSAKMKDFVDIKLKKLQEELELDGKKR